MRNDDEDAAVQPGGLNTGRGEQAPSAHLGNHDDAAADGGQ